MASSTVRTEEQLRDIIKAPPATVTAKVLPGPLRAAPSEFLQAVRLGLVTTCAADATLRTWTVGGDAGFIGRRPSDAGLIVPLGKAAGPGREIDGDGVAKPTFVGMLLMVPGVKHTLRVNGVATSTDDEASLVVTPQQSYAHCAKAFIRSGLWDTNAAVASGLDQTVTSDGTLVELNDGAVEFIQRSPFAAIGTSFDGGDTDLSPRGDPAGFVRVLDRDRLFVPERPGNRIADSLRNIIANPRASLLFVVPGDPRVLEVFGEAEITTDPELCAASGVDGKIPKLWIAISVRAVTLSHEAALEVSGAWHSASHASHEDLPTIGAMVADPSGTKSMAKRALSKATDRAVEFDYKRNLY